MTRWSVVIPVYNERAFLPDTLRSLASQSRRWASITRVGSCTSSARLANNKPGIIITTNARAMYFQVFSGIDRNQTRPFDTADEIFSIILLYTR